MAKGGFSRTTFEETTSKLTTRGAAVTVRGEQTVKKTGKLDPLVDPAQYGVIRPSRIRLLDRSDGLFEVAVGSPVSIEYRLDTTSSMGDNVDLALAALPALCEPVAEVLSGRDPFYCAGVFNDVDDQFIMCRGQFEVLADRMVNQLTLMNPIRQGGDIPEDPHYGLFGAAYLTRAYQRLIGLKSYDFTITDAPARERLEAAALKQIYGSEVFDKVKENGYEIDPRDLPETRDVVRELTKQAHIFILIVDPNPGAPAFWRDLYGKDRLIRLSRVQHAPYAMATIIGLTEGTLDLRSAKDFLGHQNLTEREVAMILSAVSSIPLGAQKALPNFNRQPKKGDIFHTKTDLWPVNADEAAELGGLSKKKGKSTATKPDGGWL